MFEKEKETPSSTEALLTPQTKDSLVFRVRVESRNFLLDHSYSKSAMSKEKKSDSLREEAGCLLPITF